MIFAFSSPSLLTFLDDKNIEKKSDEVLLVLKFYWLSLY
jgi:hypothetical protein